MTDDSVTLMITPGHPGLAWRAAIEARAAQMGIPVSEIAAEDAADRRTGVIFTHQNAVLASQPGPRVVITDTTAVGLLDPSQPATGNDLIVRAHSLVEADAAARQGALVLNASRYQLSLPLLGTVERPEGERYHIHPLAAASPLSLFDELPVRAGAQAVWAPHWFTYAPDAGGQTSGPWIDLTGRMRALVFGPYIRLPPGRWRIDARISVDPERAHVPLLFEWGSGAEFCRIMTEVRHPGSYGISLDRIWTEAESAQLRIWNAHPVFQGRLLFEECRVVRVADDDPRPPTPLDRIVTAEVF